MHRYLTSICATTLALSCLAAGQVTTHTLDVGGGGALGCQGPADPPTLSGGTLASAVLDLSYDAGTGVLTLDVTNTSQVVPAVPNPLLSEFAFNLPFGTVTDVSLLSQSGAGGATPSFALSSRLKVACLGHFDVRLTTKGGIANAAATTFAAPTRRIVTGPVRFRLQFVGPGTSQLSAYRIGASFSENAPLEEVNAACKFRSAGPGGNQSGFLSSTGTQLAGCLPNSWITSRPVIGTTLDVCISSGPNCHGCLIASLNPVATQIGPIQLPLGPPILLAVVIPPAPVAGGLCFSYPIPAKPALVGNSVYLTLVTPGTTNPTARALSAFSPRLDVTFILP